MYYRHKLLLALLEKFDGNLGNTALQKLLFLFMQQEGKSEYEFFPYKFGAFSFMSYEDKRKLIEKGLLENVDHFQIKKQDNYLAKLKKNDQVSLRVFSIKMKPLLNKDLIRYTYLKYPRYTCKSQIIEQHLNPNEIIKAQTSWNVSKQSEFFTIGYEGTSIDNYLNRLVQNNVYTLIDVRRNPLSRKHGFSGKQLAHYLSKVDISYVHFPELGIPSSLRQELNTIADYQHLFHNYEQNVLPKQDASLSSLKEIALRDRRIAITCFESDYNMCHRHKISDLFSKDNEFTIPITHI